jgi:hypothetical protein
MLHRPLKLNKHFGGKCTLHLHGHGHESMWQAESTFTLVSPLFYSLTLKMKVTCPSKMSVDFQRTTWHYIPRQNSVNNQFTCAPSWYTILTCKLTYYKFHCRYTDPHSFTFVLACHRETQFLWRSLQYLVPQTTKWLKSESDTEKYHND